MKKLNKKGFTLIELLAVIIILGILLIIAVPAVSRYIENSKVEAYVDTIKNVSKEVSNQVNSGTIKMHDPKTSYYIPVKCIKIENGSIPKSPYDDFTPNQAFIVVHYLGVGLGYEYNWIGKDNEGVGLDAAKEVNKITTSDIKEGITSITLAPIGKTKDNVSRDKYVVLGDDCKTFQTQQQQP